MSELPRGLRVYLWAIYVCFAVATIAQLGLHNSWTVAGDDVPATLLGVVIFALLAYLGERATLHMSGPIDLSLATPVHVGALLIFAPPYPFVLTFAAALASQLIHGRRVPWYKRVFNICHPALAVAVTGWLVAPIVAPWRILWPGQVLSAVPVLALLMGLYYVLDAGMMVAVVSLLEARTPAAIWGRTYRRTLLPELGASAIGILAAVTWRFDPVLICLLILPAVALRGAFKAIAQAETAQHAAEEAQRVAEEAHHKAAAALRVRDEFLTAASHDLRTPLTGIMGYAEVMQMRLRMADGQGDAWLRAQLDALLQAGRRMVATVEEITDAAQLQMGEDLTLHIELVEVGEMVRAACAIVSTNRLPHLPHLPLLAVEIHRDIIVQCDRMRLERVLQNIIGNAMKYSPPDAPITVIVEERDGDAIITVRDHGVGIPTDELPRIFTYFYRASTSKGIAGSGIGLAGSKRIVEQHGGRITIESVVSEGTTVVLALPVAHDVATIGTNRPA